MLLLAPKVQGLQRGHIPFPVPNVCCSQLVTNVKAGRRTATPPRLMLSSIGPFSEAFDVINTHPISLRTNSREREEDGRGPSEVWLGRAAVDSLSDLTLVTGGSIAPVAGVYPVYPPFPRWVSLIIRDLISYRGRPCISCVAELVPRTCWFWIRWSGFYRSWALFLVKAALKAKLHQSCKICAS